MTAVFSPPSPRNSTTTTPSGLGSIGVSRTCTGVPSSSHNEDKSWPNLKGSGCARDRRQRVCRHAHTEPAWRRSLSLIKRCLEQQDRTDVCLMFHAHGSNPKPVNRFSAGRPRCLSGRACSRLSFISPISRIRRWCRRSRPTARRVRADQEASAPKTRILPAFFSPRRNIRPMFWLDLTNSWENIAVQPKRSSTRWRTWKSPPSCDEPRSISSITSAW